MINGPADRVESNDVAPEGRGGSGERPRWGIGDVGLGVIWVAAFVAVGLGIALALRAAGVVEDTGDGGFLALGVLSWTGLQLGLGSWPFVVSRWKGEGPVIDWRLGFRIIDIPLGVGTAVIAVALGGVMASLTAALVGLDQDEFVGNTQSLDLAKGTAWIYALVVLVVVIGPAAEEFFFRGLTLRALERRLGTTLAVVASTAVFAVTHYTGGSPAQSAVLIAASAGVGLTFAVMTVQVGRLWPAVFGHMLFNGLSVARALGAFEQVSSG